MGSLQDDNEWLLAHVDQLDAVNNEAEWEWDSALNEWQMMEENDPLDWTMSHYPISLQNMNMNSPATDLTPDRLDSLSRT